MKFQDHLPSCFVLQRQVTDELPSYFVSTMYDELSVDLYYFSGLHYCLLD